MKSNTNQKLRQNSLLIKQFVKVDMLIWMSVLHKLH